MHSKKATFKFQPDASKLVAEPLNFERVEEYSNDMTSAQLATYIYKESQKFRQERLNDVSLRILAIQIV